MRAIMIHKFSMKMITPIFKERTSFQCHENDKHILKFIVSKCYVDFNNYKIIFVITRNILKNVLIVRYHVF